MTVVDLGAHVGYFSLIVAKVVGPTGRVYAFEPNSELFGLLARNIETNNLQSTIRTFRHAVSNKVGVAILFLGCEDSLVSSFYRVPGVQATSTTVETTTLDAFFAAESWPPIHFVKMDIEGAEIMALEGMRELCARNPDVRLILEFSPLAQAAAGVTPERFFATLSALGFRRIAALGGGVRPISIPRDISNLVRVAGDGYVNLFCERYCAKR
jgi:FkbM family methyltransferase